MNYLVIAGGDGTRWGNYLGVTKHFAVLNGETIIGRIVRQLHQHMGPHDKIIVASKDYFISGAENVHVKLDPKNHEADKFLSSSNCWNDDTMIIYGDVYFSDDAITKITEYRGTGYRLFCNPYPNKITGTNWGECYAIYIPFEWTGAVKLALVDLIRLYDERGLYKIGGWELTRFMMGAKNLNKHLLSSDLYYVIQDETDDIDYPDDYERLCAVLTKNKEL
jgi:hypothetical protein